MIGGGSGRRGANDVPRAIIWRLYRGWASSQTIHIEIQLGGGDPSQGIIRIEWLAPCNHMALSTTDSNGHHHSLLFWVARNILTRPPLPHFFSKDWLCPPWIIYSTSLLTHTPCPLHCLEYTHTISFSYIKSCKWTLLVSKSSRQQVTTTQYYKWLH